MPHVVLEHAGAFPHEADLADALRACLETCAGSGIMTREDVKVRSLRAQAILFGDGRTSFVHATVSMLAGRSDAQKTSLAEALRDRLRSECPAVQSISVDIRDMDPGCYRKSLV